MSQISTVKIVNPKKPGEFLIINLRDFDPERHERWEERHIDPGEPVDAPAIAEQTIKFDRRALSMEWPAGPVTNLVEQAEPAPIPKRGKRKARQLLIEETSNGESGQGSGGR